MMAGGTAAVKGDEGHTLGPLLRDIVRDTSQLGFFRRKGNLMSWAWRHEATSTDFHDHEEENGIESVSDMLQLLGRGLPRGLHVEEDLNVSPLTAMSRPKLRAWRLCPA